MRVAVVLVVGAAAVVGNRVDVGTAADVDGENQNGKEVVPNEEYVARIWSHR